MARITRYGRRIRKMFINTASVVCFISFFTIPFMAKGLLKNDVGCYEVRVNGISIGYANSIEDADNALADARLRFNRDYDHIVYMAPDFEVKKQSRAAGQRLSRSELASAIYSNLFSSVENEEGDRAYTLKTDDLSVTLESRDDVIKLLDRIVHDYDTKAQYSVELLSDDTVWTDYKVQFVEARDKATDEDIVAAAMQGSVTDDQNQNGSNTDKIEEISFAQNVRVTEVPKKNAKISSVDDAYNIVKGQSKKQITYSVQPGDTLGIIAACYGIDLNSILELNHNLTKDSVIVPGQSIILEIPDSRISVVMKQVITTDEDFTVNAVYQDDNSIAAGQNKIIQGNVGHRNVQVRVTTIDGVRTSEELLSDNVIAEAAKMTVLVGTRNNTEYKRPVEGGNVVSFYGLSDYSSGKENKGIDIDVAEGTSVKASAAGTVVRAGWYAEYGYCVDIEHSDGSITRYAHLSQISVHKSQTVNQSQVIGESGSTGYCDSPCLHFEIWKGSKTVNPLEYVDKN